MELLNDENWCTRLIRISGKGSLLLEKAYNAMTCFDDFNLLRALEDTVRTKKDYQSKFIAWWRYHHWETDVQAAQKSRYEEMMEVAAEAKLLTQKMFENNGFGYSFTNGIETASDYTI